MMFVVNIGKILGIAALEIELYSNYVVFLCPEDVIIISSVICYHHVIALKWNHYAVCYLCVYMCIGRKSTTQEHMKHNRFKLFERSKGSEKSRLDARI